MIEGFKIPNVTFKVREGDNAENQQTCAIGGKWVEKNTDDFFKGKRVILFSLPGAFTPTCSSQQLPGFENNFNKIISLVRKQKPNTQELNEANRYIQFHWYEYALTRFENDNGQLGTNPEELIAAAHAGCFNMKLSFVLNEANFNPETLDTEAILTFEDGKIMSIELNLEAKVPGINEEKFKELAENAKINCPISGVLNCEIILNSVLL